jgi:DNA repair protein RadD
VLDFAGVVATHGPITAVQPPKKAGSGNGEAPVKLCESCNELCPISARKCPACGALFPEPEKKPLTLHVDDIMGIEGTQMSVRSWIWRKHTSKASGKEMFAVTYYGALSDRPVTEYLTVTHDGYAGEKAIRAFMDMAKKAGAPIGSHEDLDECAKIMTQSKPPGLVEYRKEGKFVRVINREWGANE